MSVAGELDVRPTLLDRFRLSVAKWPGSLAVTDGRHSLTYADLQRLSRELAVRLRQAGATSDTLVGLRVPRSVYQVSSILAVFECGAAYVPIDPAYPKSRQDYVEKDAGIALFVEWDDESKLPTVTPSGNGLTARSRSIPDGTAYVIYTSGSTGPPKGVVVGHEHVLAMFDSTSRIMALDDDVWSLFIVRKDSYKRMKSTPSSQSSNRFAGYCGACYFSKLAFLGII